MVNIESETFRITQDMIYKGMIVSPLVKIDDHIISVDEYVLEVAIKKEFLNIYKEFRLIYQLNTKCIKTIKYDYNDERIKAMIITTR